LAVNCSLSHSSTSANDESSKWRERETFLTCASLKKTWWNGSSSHSTH
jgi:hypothetical protein